VADRPDWRALTDHSDLAGLPALELADDLIAALGPSGPRRAVVVAPPGAGKTTALPLALAGAPWLEPTGRIVVLEPRRLATRAAARRMADLLGERPGETVGYQTRDERVIGTRTRIEVVTEGVLTRRLQRDPALPGVAVVIFDEVHERNLPTDLGLALALDSAATLRPDLAIVAMSATADTQRLAEVLATGLDPAVTVPVLESEGRQFPVDIRWAPRDPAPTHRRTGGRSGRGSGNGGGGGGRARMEPAVAALVERALREEPGDVLVFLPGIGEIMRTADQLRDRLDEHIDIRPLAGALSAAEQDAALQPSPAGRRRVVLATDIAETSLTVEGVRIVIDSGLARSPRFDTRTELTRLTTITTSRSSAEQRAGRAGRLEAGVCYRMWSKIEHGSRPAHRTAEILEVDLAGLALELAAWGSEDLAFIDPPPTKALDAGRDLLTGLGALEDGRITAMGRDMLALPVHPRLAAMIIAHPSTLACVLAAIVDDRDILRSGPDTPVDIVRRVGVICGIEHHDRADRRAVELVRRRAEDLARRAGVDVDLAGVDIDDAGSVLLTAFADRLAGRRRRGQFQLWSGAGAQIPETDVLADAEFVVAVDLDGRRDRARIRLAAPVDADRVAEMFADSLSTTTTVMWDRDRDDVVARIERRLGAINLGVTTGPAEPGPDTAAVLIERVTETGLAQLNWSSDAISVRARVVFLHRQIGEPWPDWSVETLVREIEHWLGPWLTTATGRADLESIDLAMLLRSQLPWEVGAELDRLAPATLDLPGGRSVPVDYRDGTPAIQARAQALYGIDQHPLIAGEAVVVTVLSPADRPIQITSDLPGFWAGSWAQVRTEMAGRYPKHHWPADPTAR
jgi:ATP-dependent helicase HrpB